MEDLVGTQPQGLTTGLLKSSVTENEVREVLHIALLRLSFFNPPSRQFYPSSECTTEKFLQKLPPFWWTVRSCPLRKTNTWFYIPKDSKSLLMVSTFLGCFESSQFHTVISLMFHRVKQWSPNFAPGTGFMEDNFPMDGGGWFQNDSSVFYLSCTLFLLLSHQFHLRSSGIRSWRLGTPDIKCPYMTTWLIHKSVLEDVLCELFFKHTKVKK